jgi:hypothetical protein
MHHLIRTPLLLMGMYLGLFSRSAMGQDASSLKQRLLEEAPRAWKNHQDFWQTLQGKAAAERRELMGKDKDKVTIRVVSRWKRCGPCSLLQHEVYEWEAYRGTITVHNPEYAFVLTRSSDKKPWVVQEVTKKNSPESQGPPIDAARALCFGNPSRVLPILFASPDFKVLDVTPEDKDHKGLVRMTFAYTPKGPADNQSRRGWLALDPNHDYVIRRGEFELEFDSKTKIKQTFVYEYKEGSDHHPIPTKDSFHATVIEDGRLTYEYQSTGEADLHEQRFIPESEFTLSAFSLPEPAGRGPKRTLWFVWLGLAGIVCLAFGAAVSWLKKRRRGPAT